MKKDFQNKALFYRVFAVLCLIIISQTVHAQVSGTVFRDFNSNGSQQTSTIFTEPGVAGITVKAFNTNGVEVASTTTADDGTYILAGASGPIRIEFTNFPSAYFSGPVGSKSNTSIQFLNAPGTANLGVNIPDDYCQSDPKVVIPCYVAGNEDGHTLVTFPYRYTNDIDGNINGNNTAFPSRDGSLSPSAIAENVDFGTTYGIAYDRLNQDIYVGSYIKRKAKLSTLGNESPGAIYRLDNPASATPTKSLYVDLNAVFTNVAGTNPHPIATTDWNDDTLTVDKVFKMGLGDVEIAKDFKKLYVVNLLDKKLYQIPTSGTVDNNTISSFQIPTNNIPIANKPGSFCPANDVRPFGLGRDKDGNIYVGGTCTAETSNDNSDLSGYVWKFDGVNFSLVLNFPMDYIRTNYMANFRPWSNITTATLNPMGIVSDIEFDVNGDMILGIRDRFGDIVPIANNNGGDPYYPRTAGDILRACLQTDKTFKIENNATCGSITTAGISTAGELLPSGPGGKEYYFEDTPGDAGTESTQGSLLLMPGTGEVMSTSFDAVTFLSDGTRPKNNYNTGGIQKFSNKTGLQTGAFDVYLLADANTFGKATGLGDIELMCDLASIQIGNRLWFDKDKDGIQDADEVALPNIKVALYDSTGTKVSEVTTNALGEYYFDTLNIAGGKLTAQTRYEIRIAKTAINDTLKLTESNTGTSDLIDSDADLVGANYIIPVLTGNYGENNHSYDFGFSPELPDLKVTKTSNKSVVKKGQNVKFTVTIKNEGKGKATAVKLEDLIPSGATLVNSTTISTTSTNAGSYNAGIWSIDSLVAKDSVILVIEITANQEGVLSNVAQIKSMNEKDVDSTPGNSNYNEDDIATACYTVPYEFCKADKPTFTLIAPDSLTSVKWFKNGVELTAETGKKNITVSDSGSYYYQGITPTTLCNAGSCCPVILDPYKVAKAGNDSTVCASDGILQLKTAPAGTSWSSSTANPSPATVGSSSGLISGMVNPGIYQFIIKGDTCCADTIKITKIDCFGSIGDYVWFDKNQNGIQDAGEVPIKGIKVILYAADRTTKLDSTFTDISGKYLFDSLKTNDYYVKFVVPKDSALTGNLSGSNRAIDSNADPLTGLSDRVSINTDLPIGDSGRDNRDVDAGLIPKYGSIGDFVWYDKNGDGKQDPTEVPVKGVKVILYKENSLGVFVKVDSTITNNVVGNYLFDSLGTGNYKVQFVAPKDSAITLKGTGNSQNDSNADPATGFTDIIPIDVSKPAGDIARDNRSIDAGIIPAYGSIGDYVWFDQNNDGQQSAGELPIAGVKVILYAGDGITKLDSTVTDANGKYLFDSLLTGSYKVKFIAPAGTIPAKQNVGSDVSDSDASKLGFSQVININTALSATDTLRNNPQIDAGFVPVGSIGDYVFNDKNGDGIQNAGDIPIAGIKVYLLDNAGVKLDSTTTDINGKYLFDSLLANTYKVKFVIPLGSEATVKTAGGNTTTDSNINPDGTTDAVIIDTTQPLGSIARNNPTIDAGIKPAYGSIGDYVWTDQNNDGQQSAGELPIAGVKVILYAGDGVTKLDSTVTDANGKYLFDSLLTGSYKVKFIAPAGTIPAKQNVGSDVSDSDASKVGFSQVININTALSATDTLRNNPQIDAGFVPVGSIGDFVFNDKNGDNIQSVGDTPVAGVKVYLLDNAGNKIDSTTTDGTGKYLFTNVPSGTYSVQFVAPVGSTFVTPNSGDDNLDSDAGVNGKTSPITIDATQPIGSAARDNRSVDAGIKPPAIPYGSIGDYVWFDANKDGLQTSGESPVKGVKVYLLNATGSIIDSTRTDVNGKYLFDSLITGSYKIRFVAPKDSNLTVKGTNPLSAIDSNADTTTGLTDAVLIDTSKPAGDPGRDNRDVDAGITINLGSIAGKTFDDNDKSGTQNTGDVDRTTVKVYLYKEIAGVYVKVDSVITDSQGNYKFSNLMTANYQVQFSKPTGTTFTNSNVGNDTLDSDASLTDGRTGIISINTFLPDTDLGRNSKYNDAGFIPVPVDCKTDICVPYTIMKVLK